MHTNFINKPFYNSVIQYLNAIYIEYMIELNEPRKYNWTIKYQNADDAENIIVGKCYDFIPHKGELIIEENKIYAVINILYDFDESVILISLRYVNDVNKQ